MKWLVLGLLLFGLALAAVNAYADRPLPVDQGIITSQRGYRKDPFGSGKLMFHRGFDISVPKGTKVYPTQRGVVCFSGWNSGYGHLVVVDHGNGYATMYGHNSKLLVKIGQQVETNTVIALAGSTGHSTGPHVHYEVRRWDGRQPEEFARVEHAGRDSEKKVADASHGTFSSGDTWVDKLVEGM